MSLTFSEFSKANRARCREMWHNEDDWSLADWFMALAGELGELGDALKKLRRLDDLGLPVAQDERDRVSQLRAHLTEQVGKESADIVAYLDLLLHRARLDLGQVTATKFNEVSRRANSDIFLDVPE